MKKFIRLTLSSNGHDAIIPMDNIAFAFRMEIIDEENKHHEFTRVFLKQVVTNEENSWIDVDEEPGRIR